MRRHEFNKLYPKYRRSLYGIAVKLTRNYPWIRQDCYQAGLYRLSQLRLKGVRKERAFITQACKFAMIDELRTFDPQRYMSFFEAHYIGFEFVRDGQRVVGQRHCRRIPRAAPEWMTQVNAI